MMDMANQAEDQKPARVLVPGEYGFNDLQIDDTYQTSGVTVTEAHVVGFAGLSGDLFDVHMDDEFAQAAGFPSRIAHGLLGLSLADGLKTRCPVRLKGIATLSWNWSFRAPLLIGDRIHVEVRIQAKRVTRRSDRGIVTLAMKVINGRKEVVQEGETLLLVQV
ncbi:MaoC/PaaZ C-terminal domain-containing protein [Paraburkholderia caribensis]|uniref:MaoC/PaaZ C-terminal domain-containing protein n=2 Tax=Paraburkholderia caribensis TaxID=75105 RepID=UPI00071F7543|nr:MaoC/PaaZ C-terminal domain-containing protein [Paraburkholderia caribensis]ALP68792.1 acyl dehydratase [Paraburkholderia caribensis]AUT58148.1 acyl dehydratase [Paraburkholderia caribensis]